jgi:Tol biopolymer transport system component
VWSPDGTRIAFAAVRGGALTSTYVKAADGSGSEELLYAPTPGSDWGRTAPWDWSADGRSLVCEFSDTNQTNILSLDLATREARVLLQSPAAEVAPVLSPDGRWLAYASDESGQPEIFVRPFPGLGGRWQISDSGGMSARWSSDGRELFYRYRNALYAVRISATADAFHADRPQVVFDDLPSARLGGDYDVADGQRFLLVEPAPDEHAATGLTVVVHWLDDLRRRVAD